MAQVPTACDVTSNIAPLKDLSANPVTTGLHACITQQRCWTDDHVIYQFLKNARRWWQHHSLHDKDYAIKEHPFTMTVLR